MDALCGGTDADDVLHRGDDVTWGEGVLFTAFLYVFFIIFMEG